MAEIGNILVALDNQDDARYVLEKVQVLALANRAKVHVVRVIYEGAAELPPSAISESTGLKAFMLEASETELQEMLEPWRKALPDLESVTLWNPRTWEGVLHAADTAQADLIVRAASQHPSFGDVVRTPDDWNLLRHARVPVMLVKPQAWVKDPVVLCALDVFDDAHRNLNVTLLQESRLLAEQLGGALHVVCAYPLFEPWVGELGVVGDYVELKRNVEREIITRVDELAAAAGLKFAQLHAEEGHVTHAVANVVQDTAAELLVIGTHAREGVKGILLGNTSERILHAVSTDVVTMHAPD